MIFLLHTGTSALIIYISNIQRTDVDFYIAVHVNVILEWTLCCALAVANELRILIMQKFSLAPATPLQFWHTFGFDNKSAKNVTRDILSRNRVAAKILPQIPGGLKKFKVFGVPLVCLVHPSKDTLLCQRRAKSSIATPFVGVSITSDTLQAVKKLAPLQQLEHMPYICHHKL